MSRRERPEPPTASTTDLRSLLAEQMQTYQSTVDAFDEVAAQRFGVTRTDLRCIEILVRDRRTSPGALGPALGLTSGGVTAMLNRLERQGYLRRGTHPGDGRRVVVEVTDHTLALADELYGPIAREGAAMIENYTAGELRLLAGYLHDCRELYLRHLARVRAAGGD
jgi:DNA-binding MarR family transcriptional regulator